MFDRASWRIEDIGQIHQLLAGRSDPGLMASFVEEFENVLRRAGFSRAKAFVRGFSP